MPNTILKRWNGSSFEELYPKTTVGQISASGTPDSTTFLRGDGQWATPSGGGTVTGTGTANLLTYWVGTSAIGSLSTATYPSLTELSYVKGVTSAIQTQLNGKAASTITTNTAPATGQHLLITSSADVVQQSNITFDTSVTNTFLRRDGTWETPTGTYTLPTAAANTLGGIEVGFTSTETNRAVVLSGNDAYVTLPRQIQAVNLNNNPSNTTPTFYAPAIGQTVEYFLVGGGTTSAPTWRWKAVDWQDADESVTAATDVLTVAIPAAGYYKVIMTGAFQSASTTIGIQAKFTFSGSTSTVPDPVFNFTVSQNAAASSGDLHNAVPMNTAITSLSVSNADIDHGFSAVGFFRALGSGNFSLNIAPETGSTTVRLSEGSLLYVEQVV